MPIEDRISTVEHLSRSVNESKKGKPGKLKILTKKQLITRNTILDQKQDIFKQRAPKKGSRKKKKKKVVQEGIEIHKNKLIAMRWAKRKRCHDDYKSYSEGRKKKFGWGLAEDKVTKEQLYERSKLKLQSFRRNVCPLCKCRFRMRNRLNEHIKKQNCACKNCGMVYESAFQRSDHRWSCSVRQKNVNIKKEQYPRKANTSTTPPLQIRPPPVFTPPSQTEVSRQSSSLALEPIPDAFRSESNFVLPSFSIKFWPNKIKQPLCLVENNKFSSKKKHVGASEPALGLENIAEPLTNKLDSEIKSLLGNDKLDIILDF